MSTSFSRARVTRAFPRIFVFLLSQPSPSPCKIGGEFSYVPHFFLGNIFGRFFAQNHRLCEGCESEKIKTPVMRARVTRARGFAKPFLCGLFLGLSHLCEKISHVLKKISESFPKNSHVFPKISDIFGNTSDVLRCNSVLSSYGPCGRPYKETESYLALLVAQLP